MIASHRNRFGVWTIGSVILVRVRGRWTLHLCDFNFDTLCGLRIPTADLIVSPTFVLDACEDCRKEYRAKF